MKQALKPRSLSRRIRITPASVIATLALVLAAGGGAYAASTTSTVEWAVVTPTGKLARGNGGIGASQMKSHGKPVTGSYRVLFFDDVRNCAYKATLGNAGAGVPPVGHIGVAQISGVVNGVYVHTTNAKGVSANEGFHLAVVC